MRGFAISIGAVVAFYLFAWMMPSEIRHIPVMSWVMIALIYLVLPGGICLEIVDFVRRRSTKEKESSPETLGERIVTERVLVVCPYCGAKNEQGILKCRACGAEM